MSDIERIHSIWDDYDPKTDKDQVEYRARSRLSFLQIGQSLRDGNDRMDGLEKKMERGHPCSKETELKLLDEVTRANSNLIKAAQTQMATVSTQLNKAMGGFSAGRLFVKFLAWVIGTALVVVGLWSALGERKVVYSIDAAALQKIIDENETGGIPTPKDKKTDIKP